MHKSLILLGVLVILAPRQGDALTCCKTVDDAFVNMEHMSIDCQINEHVQHVTKDESGADCAMCYVAHNRVDAKVTAFCLPDWVGRTAQEMTQMRAGHQYTGHKFVVCEEDLCNTHLKHLREFALSHEDYSESNPWQHDAIYGRENGQQDGETTAASIVEEVTNENLLVDEALADGDATTSQTVSFEKGGKAMTTTTIAADLVAQTDSAHDFAVDEIPTNQPLAGLDATVGAGNDEEMTNETDAASAYGIMDELELANFEFMPDHNASAGPIDELDDALTTTTPVATSTIDLVPPTEPAFGDAIEEQYLFNDVFKDSNAYFKPPAESVAEHIETKPSTTTQKLGTQAQALSMLVAAGLAVLGLTV